MNPMSQLFWTNSNFDHIHHGVSCVSAFDYIVFFMQNIFPTLASICPVLTLSSQPDSNILHSVSEFQSSVKIELTIPFRVLVTNLINGPLCSYLSDCHYLWLFHPTLKHCSCFVLLFLQNSELKIRYIVGPQICLLDRTTDEYIGEWLNI